jgi:hypothetical protein
MNYALINTGCLGFVTLILFSLWRRTHDYLLCANIFSACFAFLVLGSQVWCHLTGNPFYPTPKTVLLLYTGWITFLLGMAITVRRLPQGPEADRITPVGRNAKWVLVALMLAHLGFTIAVSSSTGLLATFQLNNIVGSLVANRLNLSGDFSTAHVGWFFEAWHTAFVYYVPLAIYLYRQRQISRRSLLIVWGFASALSLMQFSRVPFLMLLVFGLVTWTVLFRPSGWKMARISGALLCAAVVLFAGMQAVLANMAVNKSVDLSDQLGTYAFSSALAFGELVNGNYDEDNPHHALYVGAGIYYMLGKLSLLNAEEYPIGFPNLCVCALPDERIYVFGCLRARLWNHRNHSRPVRDGDRYGLGLQPAAHARHLPAGAAVWALCLYVLYCNFGELPDRGPCPDLSWHRVPSAAPGIVPHAAAESAPVTRMRFDTVKTSDAKLHVSENATWGTLR